MLKRLRDVTKHKRYHTQRINVQWGDLEIRFFKGRAITQFRK